MRAIGIALLAACVGIAGPCPADGQLRSVTGWIDGQSPGFYRLRVGAFRVTALSDGTAVRDLAPIMSEPGLVRSIFRASHERLPTEISINAYLVDTGTRRILVDAGAGELFGAGAGRLVANLRAAGYVPEDVDAVLLTHIHADHSGGLSIGGRRVFENALVYVDTRDVAYWLGEGREARVPERQRTTIRQSHQTIDPYRLAGRLRMFNGSVEIFPGIRSVPEHGHTPGLTGYMIGTGGERLLLWGDVIHSAEVQFSHPGVTIAYDVDSRGAASSRLRVLGEAAKEGYLIGGAHLSFPGLGHVRREGKGFEWVPAPYRADP